MKSLKFTGDPENDFAERALPVDLEVEKGSSARDTHVVTMRHVDGHPVVVSRFGDDIWWLTGTTTNTVKAKTKLDFTAIPTPFRTVSKEMLHRYLQKGRSGGKRPGAGTLIRFMAELKFFLQYLEHLGISRLSSVSSFVSFTYTNECKAAGVAGGKPLRSEALYRRLQALETTHDLSMYTSDPMTHHPWPGTALKVLTGVTGSTKDRMKTPLMPDDVFAELFGRAWKVIENAPDLLDLRDAIGKIEGERGPVAGSSQRAAVRMHLTEQGWEGGLQSLRSALTNVRTACYIVVASLSGCRNHEVAFITNDSFYSTEDDDGVLYWWMRSRSTKTDAGVTQWMIPEAAVTALRVMERWAAPFQALLQSEINARRAANTSDPEIAVAQEHLGALLVGIDHKKGSQVRTLGLAKLNGDLKTFAALCDVEWQVSSHQFRRKFANYAARSQFGDLRYLREHFKHWSLDMTLGYAMNESQEMALYLEIQDELNDLKVGVASSWLRPSEPLAGGYGTNLVNWRDSDKPVTIFKDHKQMIRSIAQSTSIRSNGHAWCTADDNQCVGNNLERTRCADGCNNAAIGQQHAHIYRSLHSQLQELEDCEDIGESGRARVQRDLARCRSVLSALGVSRIGEP